MMALPEQPSPPPHQMMTTAMRLPSSPPGGGKATAGSHNKNAVTGGKGGEDVKQRANVCMSRLSDRDTEAMAASELDSMVRSLSPDALPSFLSAISDTRPSDKTPLRRHSLRLLSLLSRSHAPASLGPLLPRMLSAVLRRLRDPDSSVRSACVDAVRSMSSSASAANTPSSSFSSVFLKPLSESLLLEQDQNAQMASAQCLAAAIDEVVASSSSSAAQDPDLTQHLHRLLPRLVKLARSDAFKAKPALISLLGSVVSAGGASTPSLLGILVPCLAEALGSDDWAARKSAADALSRVASDVPDRRLLSGFKSSFFDTFQGRRFDKVKIVRDSMNQMLEAWKDVPGAFNDDEADGGQGSNTSPSPALKSRSSSSPRDNAMDGRLLNGSRNSSTRSGSPHTARKNRTPVSRSPPPDASSALATRKITPPKNNKNLSPPLFRKLDRKKPTDWNVEIAVPHILPSTLVCEDKPQNDKERSGKVWEQAGNESNVKSRLEARLALFEKNSQERANRFGGFKSGSRVVPFQEKGSSESTVEPGTATDEIYGEKDSDLSLIRKQLVQIENQQSSLLDLLQRFIGSSQNGIHSLEKRVHGLEVALDEISHDLAMSSGRMSNTDPAVYTCCKLPGAEFLSSKFWRRTEGRYSLSRASVSSSSPLVAMRNSADKDCVDPSKWEKRTFALQGGFIVNPLAEVNPQTRGSSETSSKRMLKSLMHESRQAQGSYRLHESSTITGTADMISRSAS